MLASASGGLLVGAFTQGFVIINANVKGIVFTQDDGRYAIFETEQKAMEAWSKYSKANPSKNYLIRPVRIPMPWI